MNFWAKAMGQVPPRPAQAPAPYWSAPQQPAQAPQTPAAPPGYQVPGGLAANAPGGASASEAAAIATAQNQGYIKRPPEWVQKQPSDRCPQCGGNSFVKSQTLANRCFDCAYVEGRPDRNSEGQVGNAMTHGISGKGASVASTRQPHGMKNFGIIKVE